VNISRQKNKVRKWRAAVYVNMAARRGVQGVEAAVYVSMGRRDLCKE
jgi:hypothetical protein